MPEHESWFSIFAPGLFRNIENLTAIVNRQVTGSDVTWIAGEHYGHGGASVQHVVGALFVSILVIVLGFIAGSAVQDTKSAVVPEQNLTVRTFFEIFVGAIYGMMTPIMGKKAARFFLPLIGTCAVFIFFSNACGLVPGLLPPTDSLKTTAACATVIFLSTHVFGLRENGIGHIQHLFGPWLGPIGIPLNILMFLIECVSHLARPLSLSLRLMANIFADHLVLSIFTALFAFLLPVPVMLLGTIVVIVQTLVFCILSTVYIGMAVAHHDHGDDHGHEGHGSEAHPAH